MDFDLLLIKVDEDEGSPFQNGVNCPASRFHFYEAESGRKIDRSAEAFRVHHTRSSFPPKINFAGNT
jgi:hypothetical protein